MTSDSVALPLPTRLHAEVPLPVHLPPPRQNRKRDLLVGVVCAALFHGGFFFWEKIFPHTPPPRMIHAEEETLIQMEMPPLDLEEPEEVVELAEVATEAPLAPPSQMDLPTIVPINAFTQPIAPPLPPGIHPGKDLVAIPVGPPGSGLGQGLGKLFDLASLDQRPILRSRIPPDYPMELRRNNVTGEVVVEFIVTYEGAVAGTEVISSTHQAFEGPAIRSVLRWQFKPGRKGGRAVNTRVKQTINFNMEDEG